MPRGSPRAGWVRRQENRLLEAEGSPPHRVRRDDPGGLPAPGVPRQDGPRRDAANAREPPQPRTLRSRISRSGASNASGAKPVASPPENQPQMETPRTPSRIRPAPRPAPTAARVAGCASPRACAARIGRRRSRWTARRGGFADCPSVPGCWTCAPDRRTGGGGPPRGGTAPARDRDTGTRQHFRYSSHAGRFKDFARFLVSQAIVSPKRTPAKIEVTMPSSTEERSSFRQTRKCMVNPQRGPKTPP